MNYISIFLSNSNNKKKELKTQIKHISRRVQTIPKDGYMYDGDFCNKKINGKGKLFYKGKLKYNGEWKNGEFHGKGTLFDNESDIKIKEGTFKHGLLHGSGVEYNVKGLKQKEGNFKNGNFVSGKMFNENEILYQEGNFKNNQLNGRGITYYPNGKKRFVGTFKNGHLKGIGKEYDNETEIMIYEGHYKNFKRNGTGISYEYDTGDILYDGMWKDGKQTGRGKFFYDDGSYITGTFNDGVCNGKAKKFTKDRQLIYDGMYKNDKKNGYGIEYYKTRDLKYKGNFKDGSYHGKGTFYEFFEYYEVGNFLNGKRHGKIKEYKDRNGKIFSIHTWKNGLNDGIGTIFFSNGKVSFKGYFKDKKKEGKGIEYNEDGSINRKGVWKNNEFISKDKKEDKIREVIKKEFNIKKFLQDNNENHLKTIKPKDIIAYLAKFAKKEVKGNRKKLIKQLEKWKKQLNKEKSQGQNINGPTVFDAYEGGNVPIKEFLEEDNRVIFVSDKGHYFGTYLEQCKIVYECQHGRSFYDYIGQPDVHVMIQFLTAEGTKFYFNVDIDKDMEKGYNVFHYKTEPKDLKVLSKETAAGEDFISALHCDPKDLIKLSKITKKEKYGSGLKKTTTFTF